MSDAMGNERTADEQRIAALREIRLLRRRAREVLGLVAAAAGILVVPAVTAIYWRRGGLTNAQWLVPCAAAAACEFASFCCLLGGRRTLLRAVALGMVAGAGTLFLSIICLLWLGSMFFADGD
jgi:hypothetical protein